MKVSAAVFIFKIKHIIFLVIRFTEKFQSLLEVSVCLEDHVGLAVLFEQCPHFRFTDGLEIP